MCMSRINRVQRAAGSHNSKPPCMQQQQQAGTKYCVMCVQVVMTTIEPKGGGKARSYDAFEYIAHSHTYMSDNQPTAKVTYDLSPIQVSGSLLRNSTGLGVVAACLQWRSFTAVFCAQACGEYRESD
eukprot:GHUV01057224.1.p1 GENE.GHUV01057224.1~~GHUV01057224.1.p1  ORF type:complete len:127 (-),score=34.13 GHUV01057224.1:46-426(-)